MKKLFMLASVALCICLVFGGLSLAADNNLADHLVEQAKKYSGTTITIGGMNQPAYIQHVLELTKKWEELTGTKIEYETFAVADTYAKYTLDITSGKRYTAVVFDGSWVGDFASKGYVEELTPYFEKFQAEEFLNDKMVKHLHDQIAKWQNPFTGETGVFLNLFQSDTNMFVIRKDWLERDGIEIPKTIPELVDIAKKYNQPPETYGWTGSTYRGIETPMVYEMILYSIGGEEFDENNKPLYDSPLGIQAAKYYVELADTTPPGGKAVNWFEATNLFMQNNVAITTPHGSGNMIINDPSQSKVPVGAAVILTEGFVPMVGGWHYGIVKDQPEEKKELAFLYTLWLTTREIERERGKLMPALTCPINYDAYSDPERIEGSGATGEVDLAARRDILLRANNRGYVKYPFAKQVEIVLAAELSSAAAGGQTPEEAMKNIQKQIEELIEEAGL